jgi:hypothetical protein
MDGRSAQLEPGMGRRLMYRWVWGTDQKKQRKTRHRIMIETSQENKQK